jgi:flagellar biosynthetic protein FlhB
MAEESFQEKTEQATPKRRDDAREKGQVARSSELSSVAILMAGLLSLSALGSYMYDRLSEFAVELFTEGYAIELDQLTLQTYLMDWGTRFVNIVAPMVIVLVIAALAVNYAQVGVLFSTKSLEPKWNRISPLSGLKKIFSARGLVELSKSLFKIGATVYITYLTINDEIAGMLLFIDMDIGQIFAISGGLILTLGFRIALLLLIMAILDYAFQRWDYEKSLRMTKQEIKEELKQQEGDPQLRARVRSIQREMSHKRMMGDVETADVVVTNPTHIAVALRYDSAMQAAPIVVAKGQRLLAERIKELARAGNVPMVENKPLARALYKTAQVGEQIPEELFKAVAEVLAFVFHLKRGKKGA